MFGLSIDVRKILFSIVKSCIFILSIVFLYKMVKENYSEIDLVGLLERKYIIIEILSLHLIYMGALCFVAEAWRKIVIILQGETVSRDFIWIWLKSNIYKYIPGNIFNYVFRQVVSRERGISHKVLIQSGFAEAVMLIFSALMVSVIAALISNVFFDASFSFAYMGAGVGFILLLITIVIYKGIQFKTVLTISSYYSIFFILTSVIFYILINYQMQKILPYAQIIAIYSLSWVLGFIIPGAPGGIGVRESVFIVLSFGILNEADSILILGIFRLINLSSEGLLFIGATIMLKKEYKLKI